VDGERETEKQIYQIVLDRIGCLDRSEVIHGELIIDECNVKTMDEVIALINQLEASPALYEELLEKERAVLRQLFYEAPLQSLRNCLNDKRTHDVKPYTWWNRESDKLYIIGWKIKNRIKNIQRKLFK